MTNTELIAELQKYPPNIEVVINNIDGGEVYPIDRVTLYIPNVDLWPDDEANVVIQVNE